MENQPAASPKQALLERLQQANNILVTVSRNPSVDQLAACLGLTLWLNKAGKHATAVFSGEVPSTLEFLKPEETLEKNTDSLRDFIIALDKSKADKLRYKVEDQVVKIFITPYRTSLSADDLEYSQGDFNVEMVVALGVWSQEDLDAAITAHGRILHDATVATITSGDNPSELGAVNWNVSQASSLSELAVELGDSVGKDHLDNQIATALLTGIVAETGRFSNGNTTPQTMSVSAQLMAAGADQQLVAHELEPKPIEAAPEEPRDSQPALEEQATDAAAADNGTLEIEHEAEAAESHDEQVEAPSEEPAEQPQPDSEQAEEQPETPEEPAPQPEESMPAEQPAPKKRKRRRNSQFVTQPPSMGGTLTANSRPDDIMREPSTDAMSQSPLNTNASLVGQNNDQSALDGTPAPSFKAPNVTPPFQSEQPDAVAPPVPDVTPPAPDTALPAPDVQLPTPPAFTPPPAAGSAPDWMPAQPWMNQPTPVPAPTAPEPVAVTPQPSVDTPMPSTGQTLSDLEAQVKQDEAAAVDAPADLDDARDEVMKALNAMPDQNLPPVQALNAQPIDLNDPQAATDPTPAPVAPPVPDAQPPAGPGMPSGPPIVPQPQFADTKFDPGSFDIANDRATPAPPAAPSLPPAPDPDLTGPVEQPFTMPLPNSLTPPAANPTPPTSAPQDPAAPPPVPPPMMPPGFPPAK